MKDFSIFVIAPGASTRVVGNTLDARPVVLTVTVVLISLIVILLNTG
jgi:hypothetical protein